MNKLLKKIGACLLAAAMVLSCLTVTPVQAKTKVKYVTRAEVLSQVEKLIGATAQSDDIKKVKDVKKKDTYYKTMSIALQAGLAKPGKKTQKLYPTKQATWDYVAGVAANVLETDKASVLGSKKAGAKLTKAQLTAFLNKQFPNVVKKSTATVKKGNVVINKPNVTLKNATVTGNLVIGDGVADKEVTLKNVIVKGKTIIRGGGVNSVILKGSTKLSTVIIRQINHAVSLKVQDDAKVTMVYINDGSNDVKIEGDVGTLTVQGSDLNVDLIGASVKKLTVAKGAENATVTVDEKSSVGSANLNAEGAKLTGAGKVEVVNVNANKTTVTAKTNTVNVKDGVEKPITDSSSSTDQPSKNDEDKNTGGSTGGSGSTGGGSTGGSGSTGGGNTGGGGNGSSDSGNTGDSGNTDTPDVPLNELDQAFAEGYPKVEMDKESATVRVIYKLKEGVASAASPAAIYNVISTYNTSWDADVEAVLHGHLGKNEQLIYANASDYIKISDSEEHVLSYTGTQLQTDLHEGIVVYSVIQQDGVTSSVPNKVQFDADTTDSLLDNQAPRLDGAYRNRAGDKIYVYFSESLDTAAIPDNSCFTISGGSTSASVTAVNVVEYTTDEFNGHYVELTVSGTLVDEATVTYTKPEAGASLQDRANTPNKVEGFTESIVSIKSQITEAFYSADGKYLKADVPCRPIGNPAVWEESLVLNIDGTKYALNDHAHVSYSYRTNGMTLVVKDLNLSGDSHTLSLEVKNGADIKNFAFDPFENVTALSITKAEDVSITGPSYSKSSKELTLTVAGIYNRELVVNVRACCFVIKVDDREYNVRGNCFIGKNQSQLKINENQLKHIDFNGTSVQIKYVKPAGDSGSITSAAGKPMETTDYIDVTIND